MKLELSKELIGKGWWIIIHLKKEKGKKKRVDQALPRKPVPLLANLV